MLLTRLRLLQITALCRIANDVRAGEQHERPLPPLSELQRDEMQSFPPPMIGADHIKEGMQSIPDLFTNARDSDGGELRTQGLSDSSSSSFPNDDAKKDMRMSTFFDLQKVLKYCLSMGKKKTHHPFLRLEDVLLHTEVQNVDLVDQMVDSSQNRLEVRLNLNIKPKRTPRAAVVFVDGDELSAVAVDDMCTTLNLIKSACTMYIIRHSESIPLSSVDHISPNKVPTFLTIEKKAHELRLRNPGILQDIIYMCSGRQYTKYEEHVARLNEFPDADVYVCCPSRIEIVQPKRIIPFRPDPTTS
ncbi:unnamed protein product [Phytomonas sp. Hart1]|nr:unnamed protein product [Phytomonas sp. Hart1]|eukprot:CCW66361.1 unnamed protein product [Phytomonas sp. isolate Hart1]